MFLSNFQIDFILTLSTNWVFWDVDIATAFAIANTKVYVPLVTLSTEDNTKLLKQLDLDSNAQLTEMAIKQNFQWRLKKIFRLHNWSSFTGSVQTFYFII